MGRELPQTTQNTSIEAAQFLKHTEKPAILHAQDKPVPQTAMPNSKFWLRPLKPAHPNIHRKIPSEAGRGQGGFSGLHWGGEDGRGFFDGL